MINKYKELYEEFIRLVGELHNEHIRFLHKPSHGSSKRTVSVIGKIRRVSKQMKLTMQVVRADLLIKGRERLAGVKERRLQRKKNGHNNDTKTTGSTS
jgi:hypothetical protein